MLTTGSLVKGGKYPTSLGPLGQHAEKVAWGWRAVTGTQASIGD